MAAALANRYGSDVLVASSAGTSPSLMNAPLTRTTLAERNIDLGDHLPRGLADVDMKTIDLIINMSPRSMPTNGKPPVENWTIKDPMGGDAALFKEVCDTLEMEVMRLIVRIRKGKV
jgi:protein-tyrosine-phosphatase